MTNPVLSSSYFPPTSWFAIALRTGNITIEIHEHYTKQTWRNRCRIAGANGPLDLIIPVKISGNHTPMKDVRVDYVTNWQRIHWHAIRSAYGKSPYFEFYAEKFAPIFEQQPHFLLDWNDKCLHVVLDAMKTPIHMEVSSEYLEIPAGEPDYRKIISPRSQNISSLPQTKKYIQVFADRFGFQDDLSIIDLLFCEGSASRHYLTPS